MHALVYATVRHAGHYRKGTSIPYISHLLQVAGLVIEDGGDEDEAIAALLHDVVEDRGVDPAELRRRFGARVAEIVVGCSDSGPGEKAGWASRKEAYLEHLLEAPAPVVRVSLADKLHNARAILLDYRHHGEELWARFNPESDQLWYYRSLSNVFRRRTASPLAGELERVVTELEDAAILGALRRLVRLGEEGRYEAEFVAIEPEDSPYYLQFAVDPEGLYFEAVHNKYLPPSSRLTGDQIAALLAHGFRAPESDDQNFYTVLHPRSDGDYDAILRLIRLLLTEVNGLDPRCPLSVPTSWRARPAQPDTRSSSHGFSNHDEEESSMNQAWTVFGIWVWWGGQIKHGNASVTITRNIEQVDREDEGSPGSVTMIDSEVLLTLCSSCGNRLDDEQLANVLRAGFASQ